MNDIPFSGSLSMPSLSLPPGASVTHNRQNVKKSTFSRNVRIAVSVLLFHLVFIWALQSGLILRAAEIIVPAEVLAQFVDPPAPKIAPVLPAPPAPSIPLIQPKLVKKAAEKAPTPLAPPAPQPLAIADPTPAPNAPTGVTTPQAALAPAPIAAVAATAPAGPSTGVAGAAVQLPSSDASYLQNPKPPYPPVSRRLNEQGKSVIRVMIGVDGLPKDATVAKSSGFDRLDQAALATVMRWRFVPGKRGGVSEDMWFNVPINWVLE